MYEWIRFHCRDRQQWRAHGGAAVRGTAFLDSELLTGAELAEHFSQCDSAAGFQQAVEVLNGFYSAIVLKENAVYATVDHARSIPLFYALGSDCIYLSDDAHWIRSRKADSSIDAEAEREFELAGYVTGGDTLYSGIKQLQAGELLIAAPSAGHIDLATRRYFRYEHLDAEELADEQLAPRLDEVLLASFRRLVNYAGGRPIAVPLSGGYDSLETVLMLKRLGYSNVIAFSYGRPGNSEARASEKAAQRLGLRWEFAPYSEEQWRQWFSSDERRRYYPVADNLCSLPVLQDWPAVWQLKERGALPADTVIVPGYSADAFPASRKTTGAAAVYSDSGLDAATVYAAIYDYTYHLWQWDKRQGATRELVDRRIAAAIGDLSPFSRSAYAVEAWGIQERQAKFITNAVRVYEYWGYDWWLPLWDRAFVDFWMKVPSRHRVLRRFSRDFITRLYEEVTAERRSRDKYGAPQSGLSRVAAVWRRASAAVPGLAGLYDFFRARMKYDSHPLAWYGMIPRQLFLKRFRGRVNINSFLALEWLGRMKFESAEQKPMAERIG